MWDQFKEQMSRDMANIHDPRAAEVSVVAELDLLLLPAAKEMSDLMDAAMLPGVPKWKQNKKLKTTDDGAANASSSSAPIKYEKTVHGDAAAAAPAAAPAPAWQEESAAKAGISAGALAQLLENDARHAEQQQQLDEQRRAREEAQRQMAEQAAQLQRAQLEAARRATADARDHMRDQLHAAEVAAKNNEAAGGSTADEAAAPQTADPAVHGAQQTLERALAATEAATAATEAATAATAIATEAVAPLPPGWVEATDPRYGHRTYWYHQLTKQTSWTRPVAATAHATAAAPQMPTPAPAQPAAAAWTPERVAAYQQMQMMTPRTAYQNGDPTALSALTSRIEGTALHDAIARDPTLEMVRCC